MSEPVDRHCARVLLLDGEGRVLLFHGYDPADALGDLGHERVTELSFLGHRWWSPEEIAATDDRVHPEELLAVLERSA